MEWKCRCKMTFWPFTSMHKWCQFVLVSLLICWQGWIWLFYVEWMLMYNHRLILLNEVMQMLLWFSVNIIYLFCWLWSVKAFSRFLYQVYKTNTSSAGLQWKSIVGHCICNSSNYLNQSYRRVRFNLAKGTYIHKKLTGGFLCSCWLFYHTDDILILWLF